ncbi:MAG TPA: hypothetical protein VGQ87_03410 [Patescibacteria group bacterium]|nr:hypothetical protein [Patescibacteria group bacterium]
MGHAKHTYGSADEEGTLSAERVVEAKKVIAEAIEVQNKFITDLSGDERDKFDKDDMEGDIRNLQEELKNLDTYKTK